MTIGTRHITIIAVGTRGDVQPYVALGSALHRAGHQVVIATQAAYRGMVEAQGLDFYPVSAGIHDLGEMPNAQVNTGSNPLLFLRHLNNFLRDLIRQSISDCWQAAQGSDVIIFSGLGFYSGYSVAEKLRVPSIHGSYLPLHPTTRFQMPFMPPLPELLGWLRPAYNRVSYGMVFRGSWYLFRSAFNDARRSALGLPPMPLDIPQAALDREGIPYLYGYSPSLLPKPANWPSRAIVTGYWFLEQTGNQWQPPDDLAAFLAEGSAPVYVGFGSIDDPDQDALTEMVITALRKSGQRGVLLTGRGSLSVRDDLPPTIFQTNFVPHEWLFPQMAAIVHHGGAGVTGYGLRAGVPAVTVPYGVDQPFWAWCIQQVGAGPQPIPRKQLSADNLAYAIHVATTNAAIRERAEQVGARIQQEDGLTQAVEAFEQLVS
ncbi:MAG: glycosyltransferase [Anaerolineae bacterium]|nr:glycosyltransferase [Anaerolineae bacterium]